MENPAPSSRKNRILDTLVLALLVGLGVYASAWGGIELTRGTGRIAAIWPANAILLVALLKRPRFDWPLLLLAGYLANYLANTRTGDDSTTALLLSICNSLEVLVCGLMVTGLAATRDFRRPKPMFLLSIACVGPATILSAALAAFILEQLKGADFSSVFATWYAADTLGLVTLVPILMVVGRRDIVDLFHPEVARRLAWVVFIVLGASACIFLKTSMPLLFLAFPVVVIAAFISGFAGTSVAVLLTAAIALWSLAHGTGPISLMHTGFRWQVHALQIFTATIALTGVAVASALGQRDLLLAALAQAPDFTFIKNLDSEFVSVNLNVARNAGFSRPEDLAGKSDFDLTKADRARLLHGEEQEVMRGGAPILFKQECVTDQEGTTRWFETSKVALKNHSGRVIGLSGTSRDITARKEMEASLVQSRRRMALVLSEMSDGIAVVGLDGYIIFCNEQYQRQFPLTGDLRVAGAYLPSILVAARDSGEQPDIDPSAIMRNLKIASEEEVRMFDGRWLHIRSRPGSNGVSTIIVSDITRIKCAEMEMRALTDQLEVLASTDGLTGLLNRRSLDDLLPKEISRCKRGRAPISLIMVDVDRFKAYNDRYGHQAGDKCLRLVANAIKDGAKRPGDVVARYGGEEIAIVLPETDEGGAYVLAEQLRVLVRELALEHEGSEKGIVTVSMGIASLVHDGKAKTADELIARADEALYVAKGAGRDRIMGWSSSLRDRFPAAG